MTATIQTGILFERCEVENIYFKRKRHIDYYGRKKRTNWGYYR